MAGNGGGSSSRAGGASISAAATAVGSAEARFPQIERRTRWRGCFGGLSCFGSQKGGKRIVPAARTPEGNPSVNHGNGSQAAGVSHQNTSLTPSLLAPPSSPASFATSPLPSTAQSPSCFLSMSANSPGGPSSTMFATGPYAHETQLVSPPVFSTYTTEPSTAPLTPPPELAHLTTPSSPDVPFARFLSSSGDLRGSGRANSVPFMSPSCMVGTDLQGAYPLYPGSPSSSLLSPASGTPRTGLCSPFPEQEISTQWGSGRDSPYSMSGSSKLFGLGSATSRNFMLSSDSNFFCSATSAQFCLDQAQQSFPSYTHSGGRPSVSKEVGIYSNGSNRNNKCKQDVEEIEAYRASFGFSADEIIATQNYVEISDVLDDSFTMSPFPNGKPSLEQYPEVELSNGHQKMVASLPNAMDPESPKMEADHAVNGVTPKPSDAKIESQGSKPDGESDETETSLHVGGGSVLVLGGRDEEAFNISEPPVGRGIWSGQSCSDAEIDYRRARSLREANRSLSWHKSLP